MNQVSSRQPSVNDHPFMMEPKHVHMWPAIGEFKFYGAIFDHPKDGFVLVVSREYYNDRVGGMPHPLSKEDINTPPVSTSVLAWAEKVQPGVVVADFIFARSVLGHQDSIEDSAFRHLKKKHDQSSSDRASS